MNRSRLCILASMALALCIPGSASTVGTFSGAGVVTVVGTTNINWFGVGGITPEEFTLSGGTGIYSGHDASINTILDLTNPPDVVGGTGFPNQTFIQFTGGFAPDLLLNYIVAGSFTQTDCSLPAAGGQTCTPFVGSPFNFLNTDATDSTASFTFRGVTADGYAWRGVFTSQFTESFQDVLAAFAPGGSGTVTNSYSQAEITVSSAVPEPGTLLTLASGLGLLLVSLSLKKLRRT